MYKIGSNTYFGFVCALTVFRHRTISPCTSRTVLRVGFDTDARHIITGVKCERDLFPHFLIDMNFIIIHVKL